MTRECVMRMCIVQLTWKDKQTFIILKRRTSETVGFPPGSPLLCYISCEACARQNRNRTTLGIAQHARCVCLPLRVDLYIAINPASRGVGGEHRAQHVRVNKLHTITHGIRYHHYIET